MQRIPEPEIMDIPERAQAYADADFGEVNAAFLERLLELVGDCKSCLALDLGTGPGEIPLRLAVERPHWRIIGLDASLPMLRLAQAKRHEAPSTTTRFILADAKRTPYPDHTFDLIFSNSILHHVDNPVAFWKEAARVAKPGALIFLRDLLRPATPQAARALVETYTPNEHPLLKEDFYHSLLAAYTLDEAIEQAESAGLEVKRSERTTDRHLDILGTV